MTHIRAMHMEKVLQFLDSASRCPDYRETLRHCSSRRFAEILYAVPSSWANSEMRYSSSIQR